MSSLLQAVIKPFDQHALRNFIEINHNVPTKYHIKGEIGRWLLHKIESHEFHNIPQTFFYPITSRPATGTDLEVFLYQWYGEILDLFFRIDAAHRGFQDTSRDIGRYDFYSVRPVETFFECHGQ